MFLDNTKKVLKALDDGKQQYILYFSDKKEYEQIKAGMLKTEVTIVAYGECNTMDEKTARSVLPNPVFMHNLVSRKKEDTYHCFCCEKNGVEAFVGHRTSLNSWDCLMIALGNPKYCVITQEKVEE
jgi:hypothetical protein